MGLWREPVVSANGPTIVADGLAIDGSVAHPGYARLALRVTDRGVDYWVVWKLDPGQTEEVARTLARALGMRLEPVTWRAWRKGG